MGSNSAKQCRWAEDDFELSRLLRGRGGTEWASMGHGAGDTFCLLQAETLQLLKLPVSSMGAEINARAGGVDTSIEFLGEGLRPPSPVDLAARLLTSGDLRVSWIRRSRQGFAWVDGIDAPLGEAREQYRVELTGSANALEKFTAIQELVIPAATLPALGGGPLAIEVRQIGDLALSRASRLSINLS